MVIFVAVLLGQIATILSMPVSELPLAVPLRHLSVFKIHHSDF